MKTILSLLLALPLIGCGSAPEPVSDPVAIPYQVTLQAAPMAADGSVRLDAAVRYGGFGSGGPARVEFRNGTEVLSATTERTPITLDVTPQDFLYTRHFSLASGTRYQIRAVVTWTYGRTPGTLESAPISLP
ncbi:hypothetical protein [Deinococcus altitudinis]|uniref:hypothetical protein n=1 Tax=Deinococcus altitudinis TaxID=468914 RepID=UPI003892C05B